MLGEQADAQVMLVASAQQVGRLGVREVSSSALRPPGCHSNVAGGLGVGREALQAWSLLGKQQASG